MARTQVSVFSVDGSKAQSVAMPGALCAPLRPDLVQFAHSNMSKNRRQAYAISANSGYQTAAESWGTGRAVSRIPRVPGGGTHRAGQAAFGNMCRGGGMFAPTKTWRKWARLTNVQQKRHAMASALSASAVTSLVLARGHRVEKVPELPLVVSAEAESLKKTRAALELLQKLGCGEDLKKVVDSKKIRAGKGKRRNRRYKMRRGPLIVHSCNDGITRAARNLPGVDLCHVDRLNLLQVAPGGVAGRLIVWTAPAFERLQKLFGSYTEGAELKSGYRLLRPIVTNSDISRVINSDEVQSALRPKKKSSSKLPVKKNGLKLRPVLDPTYKKRVEAAKTKKATIDKAARKARSVAGRAYFRNVRAAYEAYAKAEAEAAAAAKALEEDEEE